MSFLRSLRTAIYDLLQLLSGSEQGRFGRPVLAPGKHGQILMYKDGQPEWVDPPAQFVKMSLPVEPGTTLQSTAPLGTPLQAGSALEKEWLQLFLAVYPSARMSSLKASGNSLWKIELGMGLSLIFSPVAVGRQKCSAASTVE